MAYDPAIKMLLRLRLNQLIYKARELKLDHTGTKLNLAVRIAKFQEGEMSRTWQSISQDADREMIGDDVDYGLSDIGCK